MKKKRLLLSTYQETTLIRNLDKMRYPFRSVCDLGLNIIAENLLDGKDENHAMLQRTRTETPTSHLKDT